MRDLVSDIVEYHFKNQEYLLAQFIIEQDKDFAESLYFELQMQLMFDDKKDNECLIQ